MKNVVAEKNYATTGGPRWEEFSGMTAVMKTLRYEGIFAGAIRCSIALVAIALQTGNVCG